MDPHQSRPQSPLDETQGPDSAQEATEGARSDDVEGADELYADAIDEYLTGPNYGRGLNLLHKAEESRRTDDVGRTEELYRQAIDAYRVGLHDAQGLGSSTQRPRAGAPGAAQDVNRSFSESILAGADYGLGVGIAGFASSLIDQGRLAEARRLLEEIVSPETDHQLVWVQYQHVLLAQGDVDRLCWAIATELANKKGEYPRGTTAERIVEFARRAEKASDMDVARALVGRALETARDEGDVGGRWAALGLSGVILEKAGATGDALRVWRDAFEEGSTDAVTVERLAMHLEKRKDYTALTELIDAALQRGFPASIEHKLRTRRERCRARSVGEKPQEVPTFTERAGQGTFTCIFQTQVKPPVVHIHISGSIARCFCAWRDRGSIVDLDLLTGREVRRVDGLPGASRYAVSPDGWALGTKRTGPVGQGATYLCFFRPDGTLARRTSVPDGNTEVAYAAASWYVGCRDGYLYAFEAGGDLRWRWPVPGSEGEYEDAYQRPNPYFVAADSDVVVCSNHGSIYALSRDGALLPATSGPSRGQVLVHDAPGDAKEVQGLGLAGGWPMALHGDGSVAAEWRYGILSLFSGGVETGSVEVEIGPTGLRLLGDWVVMWSGRSVRVVDSHGTTVWEVELAKYIETLEVADDYIVCRAGPVVAFTRARTAGSDASA